MGDIILILNLKTIAEVSKKLDAIENLGVLAYTLEKKFREEKRSGGSVFIAEWTLTIHDAKIDVNMIRVP